MSTPLDHRHSPTRIWVDPPGRYETVNGAIYIPTPGMPGFVAGVGKRRQAPNRCRFGCLGLGRKICTSCRTAATSTCFPASSTRHRSRRLMRIGRHREGSAVPAGRARQSDSRKIPIKATSWPSPVRRLRFGVTISLTTRVLISAGRKATTKPTAKTTEPVARTPSWTHLLQLDQRLLPRHAYADEEECVELSAQPSFWCRWPPTDDSR